MAIDLDKISNELEQALEQSRLLAEQRQQARITPRGIRHASSAGRITRSSGSSETCQATWDLSSAGRDIWHDRSFTR